MREAGLVHCVRGCSHPPWCLRAVLGGASQPAEGLGSPGLCQRAAGKMWLCMGALLSLCAPWER